MNDMVDEIEREEGLIALRTALLRIQKAQQETLATKQRRLQLAKTAVQEAEVELKQEEERTERVFEEIRQQRREAEYPHIPVDGITAPTTRIGLHQDEPADARFRTNIAELTNSTKPSPFRIPVAPTEQTESSSSSSSIVRPAQTSSFPAGMVGTKIPRLEKAPTIVFYGGSWIELRCHICNGNWSTKKRRFTHGIIGMRVHVQRNHVSEPTDEATFVSLCKVRDVPMDEVEGIQTWTGDGPPIQAVAFASQTMDDDTLEGTDGTSAANGLTISSLHGDYADAEYNVTPEGTCDGSSAGDTSRATMRTTRRPKRRRRSIYQDQDIVEVFEPGPQQNARSTFLEEEPQNTTRRLRS